MRIDEISKKIRSCEYDFLRTDKRLGGNIILLAVGGSCAYGTNIAGSDLDIRGVALNTKDEILSMEYEEKPFEEKDTDTVIYPFKRFLNLLVNANPGAVEMLGTKKEHILKIDERGEYLKNNIDAFLSRKIIYSFGGYANSQLRSLENAIAKEGQAPKRKEQHLLNSLNNLLLGLSDRYREFTGDEIKLYLGESKKKNFEEEIFMDISLKGYPLRDFKGIYSEMENTVRGYGKLSNRNKKKDDIHLNKHAMHLIRLLIMGTEILEGKGVNTYREKDKELLLAIRKGKFVTIRNNVKDYSLIFEMVDEYEKKYRYAAENTSLPEELNMERVKDIACSLNLSVVQGK